MKKIITAKQAQKQSDEAYRKAKKGCDKLFTERRTKTKQEDRLKTAKQINQEAGIGEVEVSEPTTLVNTGLTIGTDLVQKEIDNAVKEAINLNNQEWVRWLKQFTLYGAQVPAKDGEQYTYIGKYILNWNTPDGDVCGFQELDWDEFLKSKM